LGIQIEGKETEEGGEGPVKVGDLSFAEAGIEEAVMEVAAVSPDGRTAGGEAAD